MWSTDRAHSAPGWLGRTVVAPLLLVSLTTTGIATRAHAGVQAITNGGAVNMPIAGDPTFDPWFPGVGVESVFPDRVLFDGLTKPGTNGLPQPDLATSWQVSRDGLTWTFNLRHGVLWHDGQTFTAGDVVYTFNQVVLNKPLAASGSSYFLPVKNVQATTPYMAVFHLSHPF
ncbi:MAG TPA: ABC transporter substrate-binding protein, partial [Chloroflexota bacterium]|nr:ABC transporter substrate-binding protein [Chloroflexota bacterium]